MKAQHIPNDQQHSYDANAIFESDDRIVEALGVLFAGFLISSVDKWINERN